MLYPKKTKNPNPSPIGNRFGFFLFGGRGWITRAAHLKKPRRGFFPAGLFGGSMLFESTLASPFSRQIKQKLRYPLDTGVLGGRGWIRTTEAESSRFTVCPHWPLGNTPIFTFCVLRRTTRLFYHAERLLSTVFLPFSSNAFSVQRNGRAKAGKALQPCRHGKVGEKSQPEEIDRQVARKTRDNM